MKKYFFILIFSFVFVLLPNSVFASSFTMRTPTRMCRNLVGGGTQCTSNISEATWWNDTFYESQYWYIGNPGSTGDIYESINFQWDNYGLCQGKNILIKGSIGGLFDFFGDPTGWSIRDYTITSITRSPLTSSCTIISWYAIII